MGIWEVAAAVIVIAACVNGGVAQVKDIDPALEQAIRQKGGEVLRDPASAILTSTL